MLACLLNRRSSGSQRVDVRNGEVEHGDRAVEEAGAGAAGELRGKVDDRSKRRPREVARTRNPPNRDAIDHVRMPRVNAGPETGVDPGAREVGRQQSPGREAQTSVA